MWGGGLVMGHNVYGLERTLKGIGTLKESWRLRRIKCEVAHRKISVCALKNYCLVIAVII